MRCGWSKIYVCGRLNLLRTVQLIPKPNLQKQSNANIYLRFGLLNCIYYDMVVQPNNLVHLVIKELT